MPLEPARFREALANWASGVAIAACRVTETRAAGDHLLVIADVQAVDVRHDLAPLIRYRRRYHGITD